MNKIFSKEALYDYSSQRTFPNDAREAAFLLGGIGTGNISLGARGELRDWEIFNRPAKGQVFPYTFFAISAKEEGQERNAKILEGKMAPPFSKSHGFFAHEMAGVPRFEHSEFTGEYPKAFLTLSDRTMPVDVKLEAFNPLIPLDSLNSGIPCAILNYTVINKSEHATEVSIVGTLPNVACYPETSENIWGNYNNEIAKTSQNTLLEEGELATLFFTNTGTEENELSYSDLSLSVLSSEEVLSLPMWPECGWWDAAQMVWDSMRTHGDFSSVGKGSTEMGPSLKPGSLGAKFQLEPKGQKTVTFIIAWNAPNRINGWYPDQINSCCGEGCNCQKVETTTKNYYATVFENSLATARYVAKNFSSLSEKTTAFHQALFGSTLPCYVLDAVSANITVLRSTTCFRTANGKFYGWEGCFATEGCCEGNCTHVWNYQQTLAFLFPDLERDMRLTEFNIETDSTGRMEFRAKQAFGGKNNFHPAADGQLGCIIRLYRDWKLCGDREFLASVWENAKRALNFAFDYWDADHDCVLDSQQHNTYDIEFYGPNSLVNSMFFGALKAGAEMAKEMGEAELSQKYLDALEKGSEKMDRLLWNGEYYAQKIEDVNEYPYQYGQGCLSDQLLGQELSMVAGLGYILPPDHVNSAVKSIFKYNFLEDFSQHHNVQRTYVLNDEKGLLLCTWPEGGRPILPFTYSDEVWTGIEYQVATHLIYENYIEEGLTIVKALRDRHDGYKRNPWNEVECGNHYARSMASWGLLLALSGYRYDLVDQKLEFSPKLNQEHFSCFFSCAKAWGTIAVDNGTPVATILYGDLDDVEIFVDGKKAQKRLAEK